MPLSKKQTRRANKHLDSEDHSELLKNKQAYSQMREKCTNIWKLFQEASLSQEVQKTSTNRFVIKCFFGVTHLLIIQKWALTSNFKNVVELIADCGGDEVKTHLLNAPGNAMYLLPLYISKYIDIMNSYIKELLLTPLRSGKFALYNDETQDITSTEQMAIYATFKHNGTIREHFVGITLISKLVESTLSAKNILSALENYLQSLDYITFKCQIFLHRYY